MLNNSVSAVHEGRAELSLSVRHRPATTSDTKQTHPRVRRYDVRRRRNGPVILGQRDKMTDYIGTERINGLVTLGQKVSMD